MSYSNQDPYYAYWSRAYAAGPGNPNCFKKSDGNWVWHEVGKKGCGWSKVSCQEARKNCLGAYGKEKAARDTATFNKLKGDVQKSTFDKLVGDLGETQKQYDEQNVNKEKCDKLQCGHPLDPTQWTCYAEKTALNCGGSTQFTGCLMLGLPDFGLGQLGCFIIPGAILGIILLVVLMK